MVMVTIATTLHFFLRLTHYHDFMCAAVQRMKYEMIYYNTFFLVVEQLHNLCELY